MARLPWGAPAVIEVKRNVIDCNAVGQIMRYMHALNEAAELKIESLAQEAVEGAEAREAIAVKLRRSGDLNVWGFLVAPDIADDAGVLIACLNKAGWSLSFVLMCVVMAVSREEDLPVKFLDLETEELLTRLGKHFIKTDRAVERILDEMEQTAESADGGREHLEYEATDERSGEAA